jgi:hypothetical protein
MGRLRYISNSLCICMVACRAINSHHCNSEMPWVTRWWGGIVAIPEGVRRHTYFYMYNHCYHSIHRMCLKWESHHRLVVFKTSCFMGGLESSMVVFGFYCCCNRLPQT